MSYELSQKRSSVVFDMTTGAEVRFDVEKATCILDINSNISMNMDKFGLHESSTHGNYSKWVILNANEGVAVTGLTSCGAVFIANRDFSRVAAGHMSGDTQFLWDWCAKLSRRGPNVEPYFILWATGPTSSRRSGGRHLLQYMKHFGIPPSRAPAVATCGKIFLARSQRGVVYASYADEIPFRRAGQAVRESKLPTEEGVLVTRYVTLSSFNSKDTLNQFMLIQTISGYVDYKEDIPMKFTEPLQKELISLHGKKVVQAYLAKLPSSFKEEFLKFEIFKFHPDWKR